MSNGHAAYLLRITNAYEAGRQAYLDGLPFDPPHYVKGAEYHQDPERRAWARGHHHARKEVAMPDPSGREATPGTCLNCGHDSPHVQQDGDECFCRCVEYVAAGREATHLIDAEGTVWIERSPDQFQVPHAAPEDNAYTFDQIAARWGVASSPAGRETAPSKIVSVLMHEKVKDALEARFGYRLRFDRAAEFDDGEVEAYMLVPSTLAPLTPSARQATREEDA